MRRFAGLAKLLTPNERLIVILRYVDRLSLSDIGQVTGIQPVIVGLVLMSIRRRTRALGMGH